MSTLTRYHANWVRHARLMTQLLVASILAGWTAGCASTPENRIRDNQALFDSFPVGIQQKIKAGQVDIGFNHDMVYLALGKPDREYRRTTRNGQLDVWSYVDKEYFREKQRVKTRYRYRDARGVSRSDTDYSWVDVQSSREFEKVRVEFEDEVVSAFEVYAR